MDSLETVRYESVRCKEDCMSPLSTTGSEIDDSKEGKRLVDAVRLRPRADERCAREFRELGQGFPVDGERAG